MTKIILTKISKDGDYQYNLVNFSDKQVIFKRRKNQSTQLPTEAEFGEKIAEFLEEKKARDFFDKI